MTVNFRHKLDRCWEQKFLISKALNTITLKTILYASFAQSTFYKKVTVYIQMQVMPKYMHLKDFKNLPFILYSKVTAKIIHQSQQSRKISASIWWVAGQIDKQQDTKSSSESSSHSTSSLKVLESDCYCFRRHANYLIIISKLLFIITHQGSETV